MGEPGVASAPYARLTPTALSDCAASAVLVRVTSTRTASPPTSPTPPPAAVKDVTAVTTAVTPSSAVASSPLGTGASAGGASSAGAEGEAVASVLGAGDGAALADAPGAGVDGAVSFVTVSAMTATMMAATITPPATNHQLFAFMRALLVSVVHDGGAGGTQRLHLAEPLGGCCQQEQRRRGNDQGVDRDEERHDAEHEEREAQHRVGHGQHENGAHPRRAAWGVAREGGGAALSAQLLGQDHAEEEHGRDRGRGEGHEQPQLVDDIEAGEPDREGERHRRDLEGIDHVVEPFASGAARPAQTGDLAIGRVEG